MTHIYVLLCFFLDLSGMGHFEVSREVYTDIIQCDADAGNYAIEKGANPGVKEVWTDCLPLGGGVA